MPKQLIFMEPISREVISASDYLKISPTEKANIESVEIVPPRLGTPGFGGFEIRYRFPIYKQASS